jgi:hypothetical protein
VLKVVAAEGCAQGSKAEEGVPKIVLKAAEAEGCAQLELDSMHRFAQRTILEVPEGWELVVGFTTDSVHSILAQVNQNSHNQVKIAIQFEDGWNVDGWCVRVEKGLCKHYKGFKSWMWVSLLFSGEPSRSPTLCDLQSSKYGLDKDCSWRVLKRQEESSILFMRLENGCRRPSAVISKMTRMGWLQNAQKK